MPIPSTISETLQQRLQKDPFLFVQTSNEDVEALVTTLVTEYIQKTNASYTTDMKTGYEMISESVRHPERQYVVFLPRWQKYTGNDIMLHFNNLFEEDLHRKGPNCRCSHPEFRFQRLVDGKQVDKLYQNIKLIVCGTDEPIQDRGLRHRLFGYTVVVDV